MTLELKVPPPIIAVICALMMVAIAQIPIMQLRSLWVIAIIFILNGLAISGIAFWQFIKAKTTLNPMKPNDSSQIVDTGIFAYSRNPMYLGMALMLYGLAAGLGSLLAFGMVIIFMLYMTYFQIKPEERILAQKFGTDYLQYCAKVRRWI